MAGAGYAPQAIDDMPMQDASALLSYWREHPPTHEILAAVFRIEPAETRSADDPSRIGALIARYPDGNVTR